MFIRLKYSGEDSGGHVAAGDYIALFTNGDKDLGAAVRYVKLRQLGHWMMGTMRIGKTSVTVSGPAGNDGLPIDLQTHTFRMRGCHTVEGKFLTQVPADLAERYWANTDGWNDLGSMTGPFLKWAREVFPPTKRMQQR